MSVSTAISPNIGTGKMNKRAVWTFSAAHLINDLTTTGIVPALLPLYKQAFHLSYTQVGLIVFVAYLTSSVMQPLFGFLTDRKPAVWLLTAGVFLSSFGLAMTGVAPSFPWILFFIGLSGLGSGAFHPEAARGTRLGSGETRGLAQAIFQVGGNAGQALGPLMIPLFLLYTGYHGLLWFLIITVVVVYLTARILPWYKIRVDMMTKAKKNIKGKNRVWGMGLLTLFIILRSWCQIGVAAFLPFFYSARMSLGKAEWLDFLFLFAGAIGTFIGGTMSDKIGQKRLLIISMFVASPFAWILPHVHGVVAVIVLILFGLSVLSSFAVTVVYGQGLLPRNLAMASGLTIGLGVGAGGIGAELLGTISDVYGVSVVFDILAFLPIIAAVITLFLPDDRKIEAELLKA
jgi:MFS transporter, FSR family, fosmidomycin resistance protein